MMTQQEQRDQALFNQIATHYARKDVVHSSKLARRSQLLMAMEPVFAQTPHFGLVVDVGCGVGAPAAYLAGRYDSYIGIDQSTEMIEAARHFNRSQGNAKFIAANVKTVILPPHTADIILSIGTLHHVTGLDDVISKLAQLARPGARFVVIEPQNGNPVIQLMRWIRGKVDESYSSEQRFFSEQELVSLLSRNGVVDLEIGYQGFLTPPLAQVILNPQAIFVPLSRLAVQIDHWLARHLRGPLQKLSFNIVLIGTFTTPEGKIE